MKNKICICMIGMLFALPIAMRGAAEQPTGKLVILQFNDGKQFKLLEDVANLSKTFKRWFEHHPSEKVYVMPEKEFVTTSKRFEKIAPLMERAYRLKETNAPLKEQIDNISQEISYRLSRTATIDQWLELVEDISNYLDIKLLKRPLADSMIKYISIKA